MKYNRESSCMRYRLAIFDFDGTLADSFAVFMRAFNECAARFGTRAIEEHELGELRGMGARALQMRLGIPAWKTPLIAREMRNRMSRELHNVRLFDGMDRVLSELSDAGIALAIVTSNSERNVRAVLGPDHAARIRHYDCGASVFGKAPRFTRTLRSTGIPAASALSIGDEIRDAEAAEKTGIDFGAVTWGYTLPEALAACSPRMTFDRVEDLLSLV